MHSNNPSTQQEIATFNPRHYYAGGKSMMMPKAEGLELIGQYYQEKYATNITILAHDDLTKIKDCVINARKQPEEYREAFIIGIGHATPIIYIKESKLEGILIADSKGKTSDMKSLAVSLQKELSIPVYIVNEPRQVDGFSCFTDALIFSRDTTSKDTYQHYLLPNLLSYLASRAIDEKEYQIAMLPDELLKTAQVSSFVGTHKKKENKIVHQYKNKAETLTEFRKRYRMPIFFQNGDKDDFNYKSKSQTIDEFRETYSNDDQFEEGAIHGYAREKGLKFVDIIEIQFYINEIRKIANELFTPLERENFIKKAKEELTKNNDISQPRLHAFTEKFLSSIMPHSKDNIVKLRR